MKNQVETDLVFDIAFFCRFVVFRKEYDRRFQDIVMEILNDENLWDHNSPNSSSQNTDGNEESDVTDLVLQDLTEIQPTEPSTQWTMQDKLKIKQLAEELMGAARTLKSSEKVPLVIGRQITVVPGIANKQNELALLQSLRSLGSLPQLDAREVERFLSTDHKPSVPAPTDCDRVPVLMRPLSLPRPPTPVAPPPHLTFHDYVTFQPHVSDVETTCCELDSPSCVLTAALVTERLREQATRLRRGQRCCSGLQHEISVRANLV